MVEGEKEWINPPKVYGVEYRTTERHNGTPVYSMKLYFEMAPIDVGISDCSFGLPFASEIKALRCDAFYNNGFLPWFDTESDAFSYVAAVDRNGILLKNKKTGWSSGNVIVFHLFYVKEG